MGACEREDICEGLRVLILGDRAGLWGALPIPGPAAPGEGEPIMYADGDESGMRSGGGRERLCRLIGELCAEEGDFLPLEKVALDRRVPCSELVSRNICCAPSPLVVSNSSSSKPLSPTLACCNCCCCRRMGDTGVEDGGGGGDLGRELVVVVGCLTTVVVVVRVSNLLRSWILQLS